MQDLTPDKVGAILPWPQLSERQRQIVHFGLARLAVTTWTDEVVENRYRMGKVAITSTQDGYRLWGRMPDGTLRLLVEVVTAAGQTILREWVGGIQWHRLETPKERQLPS